MDWRSWTAADWAAVTFLIAKRELANDPEGLRELYELVGDVDAIAALARGNMGQPARIETTR